MLSHNLPIKIEPQQNEAYNTKFKTNIVWKQLFKNPHLVNGNNWSGNAAYGTVAVADNKLTYTITTKNANQAITQQSISFTQNHVYLLSCWLTVSEDQVVGCYTGNSVTNLANVKANVRTRIFNVFKSNITSTRTCYIYPARNGGLPIGGTAALEDACLYDLTEMFGAGKEMLGRFSFLSNFPNNYYDYNVDGDLVPFTIPVYGGSINIKTGLLQITKYNIDLGYLYWQYSAAQASTGKYRKACTEVLFEATSSTSDVPDLISSGYQTLSNAVSYQFTQGVAIATNSTIYICDERYSAQNDMPAFANAVKGITACGIMPSPVTYNLTPVEIKTLLGNNKISSNATELRLIYKNSQNEILLCGGSNEYSITDGVFNRNVLASTNLFSPKQNLNGWTYPYFSGLGPIKLDFEPVQGSVFGVYYDTTQRVYGDNFVLLDSHGNAPSASSSLDVTIPVRNGNFYNQGSSTLSISIPTAHWPDRQVTLDNLMLYVKLLNEEMGIQDAIFIFDLNEPISFTDTLTNNNKIAYIEITLLKKDTEIFLPVFLPLNIQYDYSDTVTPINYNVLPVPHYTNICPIEGYTESLVTVEGDRVPDSESERRLKAITRPVFQWDFGLKLKFEGYTFADGTLCQFDNKITAYSLNATIENNECTIPYQLLDENCQGDIVAYINVSGNNYDVVVYEVYIPVIKRPKPENFLRPAIDLPSAVIASFTDGADNVPLEKLKIAVTPKQDLHGYDHPWVGGGGVNKLNYDSWKTVPIGRGTAVWENNGVTLTATGDDCYTNYGGMPESARIPVKEGDVVTLSWEETTNKSGNCYIFSGTGTPHVHVNNATSKTCQLTVGSGVTFVTWRMGVATAGDTISYKNIMVQVNSSATAYEPYENICPITGYTEANVTRTGKNLFDLNYLTASGITIADGVVSGTASAFHQAFKLANNGIPNMRFSQGAYTISCDAYTDGNQGTTANRGLYFRFRYTDGTDGTYTSDFYNNTTNWTHSSATSDALKTVAFIYMSFGNQPNNIWHFKNIQLESASSETTYESYAGQTYNIPFTDIGIVYGGTLDVKTGVLTVTRAYIGGSSWAQYNTSNGFKAYRITNAPYSKATSSDYGVIEPMSNGISVFANFSSSSMTRNQIQPPIATNHNCYMALYENVDPSTIYFSYLIKDPVTYQLTPTEVKTLLGYNNIWADTGEVEVSYYADPYLHFID